MVCYDNFSKVESCGCPQRKKEVLSLIKKVEDKDLPEIAMMAKGLVEIKNSVEEYFDLMTMWYRDVLYYKSTEDVNNLIFKDEIYDIKKQAAKKSYRGMEIILEAIKTARIRVKSNVNFELVMELLLLAIKEN